MVVLLVSLFTVSNAFVKEEIALVSGKFDDLGRLKKVSELEFWKDETRGNFERAVKGEEYACEAGLGTCMLPSYSTCFLTQLIGDCDGANISRNGSKDVRIGKSLECAAKVRCYHIPVSEGQTDYFMTANTKEADIPTAEYNGVTWMGLISGPFRMDLRSKSDNQFKAAKHVDEDYFCQSRGDGTKKCALPSFGTCFLTHISGNSECAVKMNNSKDTFLMVTKGSCKARCYMVNTWSGMWVNEIQPVSSMKLVFGEFDTSRREKQFATDEFIEPSYTKHGRVYSEYECLTAKGYPGKKCMLPSGASCFLTYVAPVTRNCDIVNNGGMNVYVDAKDGNCGVRCFTMEYIYESGVGRRLLASLQA